MARFAAGLLNKAMARAGRLTVALPGGRTPRPLLRALAGLGADWGRVHFFMTDERLVPAGSADSNFGQARRLFFAVAGVPRANLHPVKRLSPRRAAEAYARELAALTGPGGGLDLVFLGLGEDGHTASIFPGTPAAGAGVMAAPVRAPAGIKPASRITLTLEAIRSARTVVLMASGRAKKEAFARAAAGDKAIPAGRLGAGGRLHLLFSGT